MIVCCIGVIQLYFVCERVQLQETIATFCNVSTSMDEFVNPSNRTAYIIIVTLTESLLLYGWLKTD